MVGRFGLCLIFTLTSDALAQAPSETPLDGSCKPPACRCSGQIACWQGDGSIKDNVHTCPFEVSSPLECPDLKVMLYQVCAAQARARFTGPVKITCADLLTCVQP